MKGKRDHRRGATLLPRFNCVKRTRKCSGATESRHGSCFSFSVTLRGGYASIEACSVVFMLPCGEVTPPLGPARPSSCYPTGRLRLPWGPTGEQPIFWREAPIFVRKYTLFWREAPIFVRKISLWVVDFLLSFRSDFCYCSASS